MKNHKFQQVRIPISFPSESAKYSAQTDKQYARIRGIYISLPDDKLMAGTLLGFKVNNQEVFDESHEVKLLTSGHGVAPNQKFFLFEESIEAAGSSLNGTLTDGGEPLSPDELLNVNLLKELGYPYEAKIYLWLTNEPLATKS